MNGENPVKLITSIFNAIGGIGVCLACASVLYAGQIKLDDDKLDNREFDQYVAAENESDRVYREANAKEHDRMFDAMVIIQTDVKKLLMKDEGK